MGLRLTHTMVANNLSLAQVGGVPGLTDCCTSAAAQGGNAKFKDVLSEICPLIEEPVRRIGSEDDVNAVLQQARGVWSGLRAEKVHAGSEVLRLPFVNREDALEAAGRALLMNQVRHGPHPKATDHTRLELVVCEQMFGAGKTTFARVLGEGLRAGFNNRLFVHW